MHLTTNVGPVKIHLSVGASPVLFPLPPPWPPRAFDARFFLFLVRVLDLEIGLSLHPTSTYRWSILSRFLLNRFMLLWYGTVLNERVDVQEERRRYVYTIVSIHTKYTCALEDREESYNGERG